jgi:hypothetical protein
MSCRTFAMLARLRRVRCFLFGDEAFTAREIGQADLANGTA